MKTPLLLLDNGEISAFASSQDLEMYVESPDIAGYSLFDATGQPLGLKSKPRRAGFVVDVDPVVLFEILDAPKPGLLRSEIRGFLDRLDVVTSDDDDLEVKLIDLLVGKIGYTK